MHWLQYLRENAGVTEVGGIEKNSLHFAGWRCRNMSRRASDLMSSESTPRKYNP